jgi:hypothetical protein
VRFGAPAKTFSRTAKACGPDLPTLGSSFSREATVAKKPGHRGERAISRNTIAQGRPACFGVPVVILVCFLRILPCTRGCGCDVHPAFPAPSVFRGTRMMQNSGIICAAGMLNYVRVASTSLRGAKRRSNPDCFRGDILDCFASLAMTAIELGIEPNLTQQPHRPPRSPRAIPPRRAPARLRRWRGLARAARPVWDRGCRCRARPAPYRSWR